MQLRYGTGGFNESVQINAGQNQLIHEPAAVWLELGQQWYVLRDAVQQILVAQKVITIRCRPSSLLPGDDNLRRELVFRLQGAQARLIGWQQNPGANAPVQIFDFDLMSGLWPASWRLGAWSAANLSAAEVLGGWVRSGAYGAWANLRIEVGLLALPARQEGQAQELAWAIYPYREVPAGAGQVAGLALEYLGDVRMRNDGVGVLYAGAGLLWQPLAGLRGEARWFGLQDAWPRAQVAGPGPTQRTGLTPDDALQAWNRSALTALYGARQLRAGTPWWFMPLIKADGGTPLLFSVQRRGQLQLLRSMPAAQGQPGGLNTVKLCWPWHMGGLPPSGELLAGDLASYPAGLLLPFVVEQESRVNGLALSRADATSYPAPAAAAQHAWASYARDAASDVELLALSLTGAGAAAPSADFVVGGLRFRVDAGRWQSARAKLVLKGQWASGSAEVYPDLDVTLPCTVMLSGSDDAAPADAVVMPGEHSDWIDRWSRPAPMIVDAADGLLVSEAMLSIRVQARPGLSALTRLTVTARPRRAPAARPARLLQFRPFLVAEFKDMQFEAEETFAWRSDDPDGPQWRIPSRTQTLRLPAQAVGEEMERGRRFWTQTGNDPGNDVQRYIDPDWPVRYRYGVPTELTVRPDRQRRDTSLPANTLEVLENADVMAMRVEPVYPLLIEFRRDEHEQPDLRITEVANTLGRPVQNLPAPPRDGAPESDWLALMREVLPDDLVEAGGQANRPGFAAGYPVLRQRAVMAHVHFHARLAVLRLYDPYRADQGLALSRGLRFTLRDRASQGAPALLSPLPNEANQDLGDVHGRMWDFLDATSRSWGTRTAGGLAAGLLYAIEDPAELRNILAAPVSEVGVVERLSLSAMGASGTVSVTFDNGRTEFLASFEYGQLSRLLRRRVGRVSVLWNQTRHVIVYERSVEPSAQFESEQDRQLDGWPVLRKTQEYVEVLETTRRFEGEASAKENSTGFLEASFFASERIYVNSAWGRRVGPRGAEHGYEIPLWNAQERAGLYPKPRIALLARDGSAQSCRLWLNHPDQIYFYANTEPGVNADTDKWPARSGLDLSGLGWPQIAIKPAPGVDGAALDSPAYLEPAAGFAEPRFALDVAAEGQVDVLHGRGDETLLARMDMVYLGRAAARSDQAAPSADDPAQQKAQAYARALSELALGAARLRRVDAEFDAFKARISGLLRQIATLDCTEIRRRLHVERERSLASLKQACSAALQQSLDGLVQPFEAAAVQGMVDALQRKLLPNWARAQEVFPLDQNDLSRLAAATDAELASQSALLASRIVALVASATALAQDAKTGIGRIASFFGEPARQLAQCVTMVGKALKAFEAALTRAADSMAERVRKALPELERARLALQQMAGSLLANELSGLTRVLDMLEAVARMLTTVSGQAVQPVITACAELVRNITASLGRLEALAESAPLNTARRALDEALVNWAAQLQALQGAAGDYALNQTAAAALALREAAKRVLQAMQVVYGIPGNVRSLQDAAYAKVDGILRAELDTVLRALTGQWQQQLAAVQKQAHAAVQQLLAGPLIAGLDADIAKLIDNAGDSCEQIVQKLNQRVDTVYGLMREQGQELREKWLQSEAARVLDAVGAQAEALAGQAASGMKLMKCIGELPTMHPLVTNVSLAEYLFDDKRPSINTSPFVAKLQEADGYLKELGLALPCSQLANQLLPDAGQIADAQAALGRIVNGIGGLDAARLLAKFSLPRGFGGQHVKVTHGLDKPTRTAWVSARVDMRVDEEQDIFGVAGFAVRAGKLNMTADARVEAKLDASPIARQQGALKADWVLGFRGQRLVVFRDTTLSMNVDGHLGFDFSPDKVDLHPALQFLSDFARRLSASLPAGVTLEKDLLTGRPIGASVLCSTPVNLGPMGAVEIAPFDIVTRFGMRMGRQGFEMSASVAVGSSTAPVFVQIGYLGGGMWLQARADYINGKAVPVLSAGLAMGAVRAFTLGGLARGSFTLLVFLEIAVNANGGMVRAGLLVDGSAKLLGYLDVSLRLLLEATHSGGQMRGRGTLDVKVKICWCYTLRVRRQVDHQF